MIRNMTSGIVIGLISLGCLMSGCSSHGGQSTEKMEAIEGIASITDNLAKGQEQVDKVTASIDQLQAGGDLAAAFKGYTAAVKDVEAAGERAKARREGMLASRDAYIAKWQKELESIQNPDVRAALVERKAKVAANFDQIRTSCEAVRDAYMPFLKDLKEIQTALALDLNPAGVSAMKKPLDTSKVEGASLKSKIANLQVELTAIAGSMTATPAAAK